MATKVKGSRNASSEITPSQRGSKIPKARFPASDSVADLQWRLTRNPKIEKSSSTRVAKQGQQIEDQWTAFTSNGISGEDQKPRKGTYPPMITEGYFSKTLM